MSREGPRILHLRNTCGYYGAEAVVHALARARGERGLTVTFLDTRSPHEELATRLRADGLAAETVTCTHALDPRPLAQLVQKARSFGAEVLHSHDYKSTVFAGLTARWLNVPHVVTLHGSINSTRALRLYGEVETPFLRSADRVVAVSGHARKEAALRGVAPERLMKIPNGIDVRRFRGVDRRGRRRAPIIGAVGRLSPEKGHSVLLEAFAEVARAHPLVRLVVAGDGPLQAELEQRTRTLGLSDQVTWLGVQQEMTAFYNSIDLLVHPSMQEEMSIVLLEAAASALPIIATNVGETRRMFGSRAASLVEPNDAEELSRAMRELLANDIRRTQLARTARARAIARFDVEPMCDAYESVYRDLVPSTVLNRPPRRRKAA